MLSYLFLRGRCRHCSKAISPRYPAVELLSGLAAAALWLRWRSPWTIAAYAAFAFLLVLSLIDWDTFLIPDVLSLGLLGLGLAVSPINPYFQGEMAWRMGQSVLGAVFGFGLCWSVAALGEAIFKKEAMGGGDVKLLAAVGAWGGILGTFDCLMVASLLGSMYGAALLLRGKIRRQDPIPFGPFLSAGAVLNLFWLIPLGYPFVSP